MAGNVRVVDVGSSVAGRFVAHLFALEGAEVTRVGRDAGSESADGPFLAAYLDDGVTVRPDATDADIHDLLATADVVLTSFDNGQYHGGFDDASVRRHNPAVVNATTSTFGTTGPYAAWRGGPVVDWAAGGYLHITGDPDRPPLMGPLHLPAYVAGYTTAVAIESALIRVGRTGLGTHLDVSTMEAMLSVHQSTFERVAAGVGRRRTGRYTEVYPLTVRPCREGYVALGVVTDEEFDGLLIALGRSELTVDPRFADARSRMTHRDDLDEALDPVLATLGADELVALLQSHGVPAAAVAGELDVLANPQLASRQFWRSVAIGADRGRAPGDPVRVADSPEPGASAGEESVDEATVSMPAIVDGPPLDGLLVLDFTAFWAGPSATRTLADLGATVVTIERPGGRVDIDTDDETAEPEYVVAGLYHHSMNRGKHSLVLDLRSEEGRSAARSLARRADVLLENFRPGTMDRFGLGPDSLRAENPALVYVSLSGFGSSGPWARWGSYGPMIEAASSIEHRTGYAGGEPLRLGHTLPDGVGGLVGALAALRGLRRRARGERAPWYDLSQLEAYVATNGEAVLAASVVGRNAPRVGNDSDSAVLQGVFPCDGEDAWIAVRIVDERHLALVGGDGVGDDRAAAVTRHTRGSDKHELAGVLQSHGVEAFPVLTPDELLADPHLHDRRFFQHVPFRGTTAALAGTPLAADPPIAAPGADAPRVGHHDIDTAVGR